MRIRVVLVGIVLVLLLSPTSQLISRASAQNAGSKVSINFSSGGVEGQIWTQAEIKIRGKIDRKMPGNVRSAMSQLQEMAATAGLKRPQKPGFVLALHSGGGVVDAAIEIGKIIRNSNFRVKVPAGSSCVSACVLILAAGTRRDVEGSVGIHRPYFETPKRAPSYAEVSAATVRMRDKIIAYLKNMNVSTDLADDMMKIPPERVRHLSRAELRNYGLLGIDPVYKETKDLAEAAKYGISRAELIKRRARMSVVCVNKNDPRLIGIECMSDVLAGKR